MSLPSLTKLDIGTVGTKRLLEEVDQLTETEQGILLSLLQAKKKKREDEETVKEKEKMDAEREVAAAEGRRRNEAKHNELQHTNDAYNVKLKGVNMKFDKTCTIEFTDDDTIVRRSTHWPPSRFAWGEETYQKDRVSFKKGRQQTGVVRHYLEITDEVEFVLPMSWDSHGARIIQTLYLPWKKLENSSIRVVTD